MDSKQNLFVHEPVFQCVLIVENYVVSEPQYVQNSTVGMNKALINRVLY